ncbi:tetratricopeptide repeat protein [uncultured Psychroserpens sp.]|uniref:tetratricopeptide repeat protein n=1 Tax=uncultured Psychroserpens sp. TaxID=255436 RepID=UPI0026025506|nr:tetratricopeptide repeat protein [uncultured Psychroserpens sp.]
MKKLILFFSIIGLSQLAWSQDFYNEFLEHCKTNDTVSQLKVLKQWKTSNPKDPELYTSFFNYYFLKSKQEVIALTNDKPNGDGLALKDSLNQTAGYLGGQIIYNAKDIQNAMEAIDKGIALFPDRLDMRFGKVYALGQTKNWAAFTSEIIKTVKHSSQNDNRWTWTNDENREDGKSLLLSSIQTYQVQLYNTGDDKLLNNMRTIAEEILNYYPNHVESLSNVALTYMVTGAYDEGLESLFKAEKINSKDAIVLSNIAHCYKLKGDAKKSIVYYEKVIALGDTQYKSYAEQQIAELKQ